MTDDARDWPAAWRQWLQARFGEELQGDRLEAAVTECEAFRGLWMPQARIAAASSGPKSGEPPRPEPLDNGEMPFVHLLPPSRHTQ